MDYEYVILSPEQISDDMLSEHKISLNVISENSAFELVKRFLDKGYKIKNVYVDTVGMPEIYKKKFQQRFVGTDINFRVEKKADSLFKVVSAASIVAKVNRDRIVEEWKFKEGIEIPKDYGSGYPGDAKTVEWLKNNCDRVFQLPTIARFSWKTCETLAEKLCCKVDMYSSMVVVSNEHLGSLGVRLAKTFTAKISRTQLYRNADEMVEVSGAFEL